MTPQNPSAAPEARNAPSQEHAAITKAQATLSTLLEKVRRGEAPNDTEIKLYRALRDANESKDPATRERAQALLKTQLGEIAQIDVAKDKQIQAILGETTEALEWVKKNSETKIAGKLGPVVANMFAWSGEFKETTDYDEFLDMLRAIVALQSSGKTDATKLTQADWKRAGHDGQIIFDTAELAEINAFYTHVIEQGLGKRAEILAQSKTGRDLMVALLKQTDARYITGQEIRGTTHVSKGGTTGAMEIKEADGKTDVVDILFSGKHPWSVPQVRDILRGSKAAPDSQDIARAYKAVMGTDLNVATLAEHPEQALAFQQTLTQKIELITQLSRASALKWGHKDVSGKTGLSAVLQAGWFDTKVRELTGDITANNRPLPSLDTQEGKDMLASATRFGLPILISLLTQGLVIGSFEKRDITSEAQFNEIAKRYGKEAAVGTLIHNAFLGKSLSFRFGENHAIENYVRWVEASIQKFGTVFQAPLPAEAKAHKPSDLLKSTDSFPAEERAFFNQMILQYGTLTSSGMSHEQAVASLRDSLFKMVNVDVAKRSNESDWSFRLGLLFIGFAHEGIDTKTSHVKNAALSERASGSARKLTEDDLKNLGMEARTVMKNGAPEYQVSFSKGAPNFAQSLPDWVSIQTIDGKTIVSASKPFDIRKVILRSADNQVTTEYVIREKSGVSSAPIVLAPATPSTKTAFKSIAGAATEQGNQAVSDASIHRAINSAFASFETWERQRPKFQVFQKQLQDIIAGKNVTLNLANVENPKVRSALQSFLSGSDFKAYTPDQKALVYASMLAETAGDNRIVRLSRGEKGIIGKGQTLKALLGDAWGHTTSTTRRLREWGVSQAGTLDSVRSTAYAEVGKLSTLKPSVNRVDGIMAFSVFSQLTADKKLGFHGVPFVGTSLNMVGTPKEFESSAMREKMAKELPGALIDGFATKLKPPFTSANVRALLANPNQALNSKGELVPKATDAAEADKQYTLSSKLKFGMFEKCLNDVYFFSDLEVTRPGSPAQSVTPPAVTPNVDVVDADSLATQEVVMQDGAVGLGTLGLVNRARSSRSSGGDAQNGGNTTTLGAVPNPGSPVIIPDAPSVAI